MAEVINLNRARKARARAEQARQAEENRTRHGLTRKERQDRQAEVERATRDLDGKKLE